MGVVGGLVGTWIDAISAGTVDALLVASEAAMAWASRDIELTARDTRVTESCARGRAILARERRKNMMTNISGWFLRVRWFMFG